VQWTGVIFSWTGWANSICVCVFVCVCVLTRVAQLIAAILQTCNSACTDLLMNSNYKRKRDLSDLVDWVYRSPCLYSCPANCVWHSSRCCTVFSGRWAFSGWYIQLLCWHIANCHSFEWVNVVTKFVGEEDCNANTLSCVMYLSVCTLLYLIVISLGCSYLGNFSWNLYWWFYFDGRHYCC